MLAGAGRKVLAGREPQRLPGADGRDAARGARRGGAHRGPGHGLPSAPRGSPAPRWRPSRRTSRTGRSRPCSTCSWAARRWPSATRRSTPWTAWWATRTSAISTSARAAAKLDDAANWLPARLSALLLIAAAACTGQDARGAFRIWRRDRRNHASPNSAQTESAMAGALGVRLAGPASYFGHAPRQALHRRRPAAHLSGGHLHRKPDAVPWAARWRCSCWAPCARGSRCSASKANGKERMSMCALHGGDWAGYLAEFGAMPLDFSANTSPLGLPPGVRPRGGGGAGGRGPLPGPGLPRAAPGAGRAPRGPAGRRCSAARALRT